MFSRCLCFLSKRRNSEDFGTPLTIASVNKVITGVYISHFGPRGGGQKYVVLLGWGKNMMIYKKTRKYKGKEEEKQGKGKIFTVFTIRGKKYNFNTPG